MCGRFALYTPEKIALRFVVQQIFTEEMKGSYNIAPGQYSTIILENRKRIAAPALWGLQPPWLKSGSQKKALINLRSESLLMKKGMRTLLRHRCLIPANGFYEWMQQKGEKQPYYFFDRDNDLIAFAGIYQLLEDNEGNNLFRYAIITTEPNPFMKRYHHRMPFIVSRSEEASWMSSNLSYEEQRTILQQVPQSALEARQVSRTVNSPRNDSPSLIHPVS